MKRVSFRSVLALVGALCVSAVTSSADAQHAPATTAASASPAGTPASTDRPRSTTGRVAAAARQGTADEVVLPVTEVRARRHASAARREPAARSARVCLKAPVEIRRLRSRDAPRWVGSLTDCNGRPTLRAMAALALLAQPNRIFSMNLPAAMGELRRMAPAAGLALVDDAPAPRPATRRAVRTVTPEVIRDPRTRDPIVEVARGARALHPRLLQLLQAVVEHFPGHTVEIVSGYRPGEGTSRHSHARALDLRLLGVRHEELRDFARTLPGAGVGFYPNSVFIHLDVRDTDEGRAFWTDYSGPGETPRYGHWPPTDQDVQNEVGYMVNSNGERLSDEARREWNSTHGSPANNAHGSTSSNAPARPEREPDGDDAPSE